MHALTLSENSAVRPKSAVMRGIFLIHKETFSTGMLSAYQDPSVAVPLEGRYPVKAFDSKIRHFFKDFCSLSQNASSAN